MRQSAIRVGGPVGAPTPPLPQRAGTTQIPLPSVMTERAAMELDALKREYFGSQIQNLLDLPPSELEKQRARFPHAVLQIEATKVLQSTMPTVEQQRRLMRLVTRANSLLQDKGPAMAGAQPSAQGPILASPMQTDVPAGSAPTPLVRPQNN